MRASFDLPRVLTSEIRGCKEALMLERESRARVAYLIKSRSSIR
jgi:hypothetical protein